MATVALLLFTRTGICPAALSLYGKSHIKFTLRFSSCMLELKFNAGLQPLACVLLFILLATDSKYRSCFYYLFVFSSFFVLFLLLGPTLPSLQYARSLSSSLGWKISVSGVKEMGCRWKDEPSSVLMNSI